MDRRRKVAIQEPPNLGVESDSDNNSHQDDDGEGTDRIRTQLTKNMETQEPFMGVKVRRRSSMYRQFKGDYLNVPSNQQIMKLLVKHGDREVLYADSVVKVNREGHIKRRLLIVTDASLYTLDNRWCDLKRRIPLNAIQQLCLSEYNDNFFAIIVHNEYDCLLASTRKSEIVTILNEAVKNITLSSLQVSFSNRFQYRVDSDTFREVNFEEVDGAVKMTMIKK